MDMHITGAETADDLIKQLVYLRHLARLNIKRNTEAEKLIQKHRDKCATLPEGSHNRILSGHIISGLEEHQLQLRFAELEIGKYLVFLCPELDKKVPREALFDAINTNKADRDTEDVRKYGDKASSIIFVLDLENSATKDDDILTHPLKWCHTMTIMNAMQTSSKVARAMHEAGNEFFNGLFGEYRETPLMDRLAGRAV